MFVFRNGSKINLVYKYTKNGTNLDIVWDKIGGKCLRQLKFFNILDNQKHVKV